MNAPSDVAEAPATMTLRGRQFLRALASKATHGCFLEIGPLFGSSTQAIAEGRRTDAPIHTIDTFEPAPWVRRRLGFDLSREAFDQYTSHIADLVVHQGFSPDVVRESWTEDIGFFFDDATHGDPGWSDNFNFFSPFFTHDAIVCGDDFAGGWPDIPRNVTQIADRWGVGLYVIGRVWALTRHEESRIVQAADSVFPKLAGSAVESDHGAGPSSKAAAFWSRGLHQRTPLQWFRCLGAPLSSVRFTTFAPDGTVEAEYEPGDRVELTGISGLSMAGPPGLTIQFCTAGPTKTETTKSYSSGRRFDVPPDANIVALRFDTPVEAPSGDGAEVPSLSQSP